MGKELLVNKMTKALTAMVRLRGQEMKAHRREDFNRRSRRVKSEASAYVLRKSLSLFMFYGEWNLKYPESEF